MAKAKPTTTTQTNQKPGELFSAKILRSAPRALDFLTGPASGERDDYAMPKDMVLDFLLEHDIHSMDDLKALRNMQAADQLSSDLSDGLKIICEFLPALQWYIDLSITVLDALNGDSGLVTPGIEPQRKDVARLLDDVMTAYAPALQETSTYVGEHENIQYRATIELLRRYWTFASYVKALALQVWPQWRIPKQIMPV